MSSELASEAYHREAASWDRDRALLSRRSARIAWRVAGAGWLCAVACAVAVTSMVPLKRVEPYIVRVDRSSGQVDVVPVYAGTSTMDESVSRYFLTHYVMVCERYNLATAESDYEECGAFNSAPRNLKWAALWNPNNPASPLNKHRDGSLTRVQVESVTFFRRSSGATDLAQVRYVQLESSASGSDTSMTHWIATIQFGYFSPSQDPRLRRWNPLGFRVLDFNLEADVPTVPHPAVASP